MLMPINDISNNNKSCSPVVGLFCDYNYMYTLSKTIKIPWMISNFEGFFFYKKNHNSLRDLRKKNLIKAINWSSFI